MFSFAFVEPMTRSSRWRNHTPAFFSVRKAFSCFGVLRKANELLNKLAELSAKTLILKGSDGLLDLKKHRNCAFPVLHSFFAPVHMPGLQVDARLFPGIHRVRTIFELHLNWACQTWLAPYIPACVLCVALQCWTVRCPRHFMLVCITCLR